MIRILLIPEEDLKKIVMYYDKRKNNVTGSGNNIHYGETSETYKIFGKCEEDKSTYKKLAKKFNWKKKDRVARYIKNNYKYYSKFNRILKVVLALIKDSLRDLENVIRMYDLREWIEGNTDNDSIINLIRSRMNTKKKSKVLSNKSKVIYRMFMINMRYFYLFNLVKVAEDMGEVLDINLTF